MNPRARQFLLDAMIAASLVTAVAVAHAAYTRTAGCAPACSSRAANYAAPPHPHIACAFAIAEECRKLDWGPE
jgi:hypothetical protein